MNIVVCIKQVPGTNKVEVDQNTGALKRDGVDSKMNPYDLYAIEFALKMKEKTGGTVTVCTMGPPQATEIIKEAYAMGVDNGYLFSDRRFAGSDVLATSYTLSQGIKMIGEFDIIICGKQTTDGDTAQVGPAISEFLDIPHAAWVDKLIDFDEQYITVQQDLNTFTQTVKVKYPCLITVEKGVFEPRLPSYKKKIQTKDRPVATLTLNEFGDRDESNYGLMGSGTSVERIFPPETKGDSVFIRGSFMEQCDGFMDVLKKGKYV
ncbi:electron transfer flavoprotein subunit beta/FixA family protein [Anaerotignum faecicola]|nr:electron transfer flavoprotein subunit beta/FixA family protein [Anaerotignum faecicola]